MRNRTNFFLGFVSVLFFYGFVYAGTAQIQSFFNDTDFPLYAINQSGLVISGKAIPPHEGLSLSTPLSIPKYSDSLLPGLQLSGVGAGPESDKPLSFEAGDIISLYPLRGKGFAYLNEEFAEGMVTVVFQAKDVSGDVQLAISSIFSPEPDYTIIIGGQNNSRSSILKNGVERAYVTRSDNPIGMAGILATQDVRSYPQYWVCYDKGLIIVGKGAIGDNVFLCWRDPEWNPSVRRVGFGSGVTSIKYTGMLLLPSLDTVAPRSVYQTLLSKIAKTEEEIVVPDEIKFGGIIRLKNVNGKYLQAKGNKVSLTDGKDGASYWILRVPNKPVNFNFGVNIRKGNSIALEALEIGKSLSDQRVSVDCKVDFDQGTDWKNGLQVHLINASVKLFDDFWIVESYDPPLTDAVLPTGSIVAFKNVESSKYLTIQKAISGGNLTYGGGSIVLKSIKFIQKGTEQPSEKAYYLIAGPKASERSKGQWTIQSAEGKTGEIKYRDIIKLSSGGNLVPRGLTQADQWMILDPKDTTNINPIKKGAQIALKSITDLSYIGCSKEGTVDFATYVSDDEKWIVDSQAEEGVMVPMAYANGLKFKTKEEESFDFNSQFRIVRSGYWTGLQSIAFNQNLEVSANGDGKVKLGTDDFYYRETDDKAGHFLIRKIGEDYYLFSRLAECMVNNIDENKPLSTKAAGKKAGYINSAKFKLEILSKPKIEILNAEYASVNNPEYVYDVTEALQSLVNGDQLIVPAGSEAKKAIFGDPAPSLAKKLTFGYRHEGKVIEKTISDQEAFLIGMDKTFEQTNEVNATLMGGEYFWLSKYPLRIAAQGSVVFQAQAIDDIHIALSSSTSPVFGKDTPIYEFKIGTENNTKTILNKRSQKFKLANISSPNITSQEGFKTYWISITNKGVILFGQGNLGENLMLAVQDDKLLKDVKFVGFSCGQKPINIRNITFAPSVNLDVPERLTAEYRKKLITAKESMRQLTIVARFGYFLYTKEELGQIFIANEAKHETPVEAKDKKLDKYFSVTVNEAGTPILIPEGAKKTDEYLTMETVSTVVSSLSEVAGSIGTAAGGAAVGAAVEGGVKAGADIMKAGIDAAYAGPTDVRTQEYKNSLADVFSDAQVAENNKAIEKIEAELKDLNPTVREDFEKMIELYSDMFLYMISDGNVNIVKKKNILDGLKSMILVYKKRDVNLYNNLIKMLLSAYNNPFLFGQTSADISSKRTIFTSVNDIARVMFKLVNEVEIPDLFGNYLWLDQEFVVDGNGAIKFDLETEKDAFFAFSSQTGAIRDTQAEIPLYELIIGRYVKGVGSIAFRLSNEGILPQDAAVYPSSSEKASKAMPQMDKFKTYWFSIKTENGKAVLDFGVGPFESKNVVLSWTDISPYNNIKYIGIGSWGSTPDEPSMRMHKIKNLAVSQKPLGDAAVKWVPVCTTKPAAPKTATQAP